MILLEKLPVSELVKIVDAFKKKQGFLTINTKAQHLSISSPRLPFLL
jgi:hypothetical protein